jgi:hypothetical protein
MNIKYTKWPLKRPLNIPTLSISDHPKFTQIWDFGLKINHLATPGLDGEKARVET